MATTIIENLTSTARIEKDNVSNELNLCVKEKNLLTGKMNFAPIVKLDAERNENHTHKLGNYFFTLSPSEKEGVDYGFEEFINKNVAISRL